MASPPPVPDSAELLQQLYAHAELGLAVFGPDARLLSCNAGFALLAGLPAEMAVPGQPLGRLLRGLLRDGVVRRTPAEAAWHRRWLTLDGDAPPLELTRRDGRSIEIRRRRTDAGGAVVVINDTSERRALQQAKAAELERLRGRPVQDFVDEADRHTLQETLARRRRGIAEAYELTLVAADGTRHHCVNNATPLTDEAGRLVGSVGLWTDITALKDAERRLAEQSQALALTVEALHEGVFTSGRDGRAVVWNRRLLQLLDLPEALLQQRPTIEQLRQFQVARGDFAHDPVFGSAERRRGVGPNYRRLSKDGRLLEVEGREAADGCVVRTYRDVTADARAAEALRLSEQRFRSMADAAPALIWLGDAEGRPLWFNQRWLACTGRTLAEELQRSWADRMHADDLARCLVVYQDAAARRAPFEVEYRVPCADGRVAWVADHGTTRWSASGGFEGYTCYGWDITERKAAQQALAAARDEAERLSHAKSEFLSRMSHELRTPLNAVLGFAQLLAGDTAEPLTPRQRERVHELQRGGTHLLDLINDVLDLARIEAGTLRLQPQAVALADAVRECQALVAPLMQQHGVQLEVQGPAGCHVQADPTRLRQVLLNLLSNAAKYNRPGGRAQLRWADAGARLRLEVHDEGAGLTPAQQARLFSPFERLGAEQGTVEGTGIGLALSKWLVERMGGAIGVCSSPGAGSCFWVELQAAAPVAASSGPPPHAPAMPSPTTSPPPAAPPAGAAPRRVLYIEDNEVNRLLMQGMLAQHPGLELQLAALPEQGLAMALASPPALVLLDIQLPGMDGFEVLARLRADARTAGVPVVAVSANAMPADRERAARAGFDEYVTKPIDMAHLLAVVRRWLAN